MSILRSRGRAILICAALTMPLSASTLVAESPPPKQSPGVPATPAEIARALQSCLDFFVHPVQRVREAQARAQASNNLRQMALAIQKYHEAVPTQLAPNAWMTQLLPYIEQNNLYRSVPMQLYNCPSDPWTGSRFGASIEPVSPVLASQLALPKDQGQVIGEVEKGKAADKAGLRQYDLLLKLNDKDVPRDSAAFAKQLAEIRSGQIVDAVILRGGKRVTVKRILLADATSGAPWGLSDYARSVDALHWVTPKMIADGTSNTIMLGEAWGGPTFQRDGWKVWSKGDPILATTFRARERFTTRHQEGSLVLTVLGTIKEGKPVIGGISVREGNEEKKYTALDKVPAEYRDKVAQLIELSAK